MTNDYLLDLEVSGIIFLVVVALVVGSVVL